MSRTSVRAVRDPLQDGQPGLRAWQSLLSQTSATSKDDLTTLGREDGQIDHGKRKALGMTAHFVIDWGGSPPLTFVTTTIGVSVRNSHTTNSFLIPTCVAAFLFLRCNGSTGGSQPGSGGHTGAGGTTSAG